MQVSAQKPVRRALAALLDLLYPRVCGCCSTPGQGLLCPSCDTQITRLSKTHSLHQFTNSTITLPIYSAVSYNETFGAVVHAFKYGGTPHLADVFAPWMADAWRMHALAVDLVIPVPLHAARMRERGYNQSEWLASRVADAIAAPHAPQALKRTRSTSQQALLKPGERLVNVSGAFAANKRMISNARILIVDDVVTTGATLLECAAACLNAGAKEVAALTIARADL
jgi:ComF family protein